METKKEKEMETKEGYSACGKTFSSEGEAKEFERERRVGKWYDKLSDYVDANPKDSTFNKRKLAEHLADTHPFVYEW